MPETFGAEDVIVLAMPTAAAAAVLDPSARPGSGGYGYGRGERQRAPRRGLGRAAAGSSAPGGTGSPHCGVRAQRYCGERRFLVPGTRVVLTPLAGTAPDALAKVEQIWAALGAEIETLSVEVHDAVLAHARAICLTCWPLPWWTRSAPIPSGTPFSAWWLGAFGTSPGLRAPTPPCGPRFYHKWAGPPGGLGSLRGDPKDLSRGHCGGRWGGAFRGHCPGSRDPR